MLGTLDGLEHRASLNFFRPLMLNLLQDDIPSPIFSILVKSSMVTASSPLDPIVNCVILVLSFPWTYLEKK